MWAFLSVCAGGALGSGLRYALGAAAHRAFGESFPLGTLLVNLIGSFAVGLLAQLALTRSGLSPELRLFLTTGLCGGFTTYSTFNLEMIALFQRGSAGLLGLYFVLTVAGCLGAGALGLLAGRALFG